jgi:hypothetical protein
MCSYLPHHPRIGSVSLPSQDTIITPHPALLLLAIPVIPVSGPGTAVRLGGEAEKSLVIL